MDGDANDWWNRSEDERKAAHTLKSGGHWQQCYHHGGQAIEFALKSIYLQRNNLNVMPEHCKSAKWHSLTIIRDYCNINAEFGGMKEDVSLYSNWLTVRDWDSNARFPGKKISKQDVIQFMVAAFNKEKGVYTWLQNIFQKN